MGTSRFIPFASKDIASAEAVHKAWVNGGQVTMPFGPTIWAKGFPMLFDKYGINWMVNCE